MRERLPHLAAIDIYLAVAGTTEICAIGKLDLGDRSQLQRRGIDRLVTLLCPSAGRSVRFHWQFRRCSPRPKGWPGDKFNNSTPANNAASDRTVVMRDIRPIKTASATRRKATARNPAGGPVKASPAEADDQHHAEHGGRDDRNSRAVMPEFIHRIRLRHQSEADSVESDCRDRHRGADPKMRGPHRQRVELDEAKSRSTTPAKHSGKPSSLPRS